MSLLISGDLRLAKGFAWNETVWNPSMISTALWLDAADASTITLNGSTVSQWNDKSGNGRNAAEATNRPALTSSALNGKNAITFDGVNDQLIIGSAFLTAYPFLIACVAKENNGGFGGVLSTHGTDRDNSPALKVNGSRKFEYDAGGPIGGGPVAPLGILESSTTGASWSLICGRSLSATNHALFFNGSPDGTSTTTLEINNLSSNVYIGKYRAYPSDTNFGAFDLAELVVMSAGVTDATRQRIEGYLAHKWGLGASLPSDHPYKTVGPTP